MKKRFTKQKINKKTEFTMKSIQTIHHPTHTHKKERENGLHHLPLGENKVKYKMFPSVLSGAAWGAWKHAPI